MHANPKRIFEKFVPFAVLGISIVLIIAILIMFSYLFIWGLLVGGIIWLAAIIMNYFSPNNTPAKPNKIKTKGRVIEHEKD